MRRATEWWQRSGIPLHDIGLVAAFEERDDLHLRAALGAKSRVDFKDTLDQSRPAHTAQLPVRRVLVVDEDVLGVAGCGLGGICPLSSQLPLRCRFVAARRAARLASLGCSSTVRSI